MAWGLARSNRHGGGRARGSCERLPPLLVPACCTPPLRSNASAPMQSPPPHTPTPARFTTLPFTLDESQLSNTHVHLTNSSVQRDRAEAGLLPDFLRGAGGAGQGRGAAGDATRMPEHPATPSLRAPGPWVPAPRLVPALALASPYRVSSMQAVPACLPTRCGHLPPSLPLPAPQTPPAAPRPAWPPCAACWPRSRQAAAPHRQRGPTPTATAGQRVPTAAGVAAAAGAAQAVGLAAAACPRVPGGMCCGGAWLRWPPPRCSPRRTPSRTAPTASSCSGSM